MALRRNPPATAERAPWPCRWCGHGEAYWTTITPSQYEGGRLVARAVREAVCVPCAAYLKFDLAGAATAAVQVAHRRNIAAGKRADRRAAMRQAQTSLF